MPISRAKPAGIPNYTNNSTAPGSPAEGDLWYDPDVDTSYVYSGAAWLPIYGSVPWIAVSFTNSWVNYGSGWPECQYRKIGDIVYLRGLMKSGTVTASAFTLPVGYRPPAGVHLPAFSIELFGACVIYPDGTAVPTVGNNNYFSWSGVQFSVTV